MIKTDELSINAKGGTELLKERLSLYLQDTNPEALEKIDFYFSRVRDFDPSKPSVYYAHDLAGDSEAQHLKTNKYDFDVKVFVSWWQYEQYLQQGLINNYKNNIVIPNSIDIDYEIQPILTNKFCFGLGSKDKPIKLIYHTTPHRGLELLVPVFIKLYNEMQKQGVFIELDVYSSFNIYGWGERDKNYQPLFDICSQHPGINYYGSVPNNVVIEALKQTHIYAFPSIWCETGCLSLIEAMATGNFCVHSSLGALPETSSGYTVMYPFVPDTHIHTQLFETLLRRTIEHIGGLSKVRLDLTPLKNAAGAVRSKHNWNKNKHLWDNVITQLI